MKAIHQASDSKKVGVIQREARVAHAQELLGKHYKRSVVRSGERVKKINSKIYQWTFKNLPKKHRKKYKKIAQTIIDESLKYQFDPVFLLSVIQGESGFDPNRLGKLDEIGLMQVRPSTGKWIAGLYGMRWSGNSSLHDPIINIRLGAAYLDYLRSKFDSHARLYLAAYNMGQGNVGEALEKNVWPKDYPIHVMKFYVEFYSALDAKSSGSST
ncbi:MAG: lytic transglycosylase domain-containing protein [Bdellovibrionales bacterium]